MKEPKCQNCKEPIEKERIFPPTNRGYIHKPPPLCRPCGQKYKKEIKELEKLKKLKQLEDEIFTLNCQECKLDFRSYSQKHVFCSKECEKIDHTKKMNEKWTDPNYNYNLHCRKTGAQRDHLLKGHAYQDKKINLKKFQAVRG